MEYKKSINGDEYSGLNSREKAMYRKIKVVGKEQSAEDKVYILKDNISDYTGLSKGDIATEKLAEDLSNLSLEKEGILTEEDFDNIYTLAQGNKEDNQKAKELFNKLNKEDSEKFTDFLFDMDNSDMAAREEGQDEPTRESSLENFMYLIKEDTGELSQGLPEENHETEEAGYKKYDQWKSMRQAFTKEEYDIIEVSLRLAPVVEPGSLEMFKKKSALKMELITKVCDILESFKTDMPA